MALDFDPVDSFIGHLGGGRIDLDSDTFKAVLTNVALDLSEDEALADLTEIAAGNGYSTGGVTLTSVTWTEVAPGKWRFDSADFEWSNAGAAPMAQFQYIAVYSDTSTGKYLVGRYDFGTGITLPVGATFRMEPGAEGHAEIGVGTIGS